MAVTVIKAHHLKMHNMAELLPLAVYPFIVKLPIFRIYTDSRSSVQFYEGSLWDFHPLWHFHTQFSHSASHLFLLFSLNWGQTMHLQNTIL